MVHASEEVAAEGEAVQAVAQRQVGHLAHADVGEVDHLVGAGDSEATDR